MDLKSNKAYEKFFNVIIEDVNYTTLRNDFEYLDRAFEGLRSYNEVIIELNKLKNKIEEWDFEKSDYYEEPKSTQPKRRAGFAIQDFSPDCYLNQGWNLKN